jgi:uncharacterized membrane protein YphA (DoxX/SURF4 family)
MVEFDSRLNAGWWALRIGLGVGPIITGIDKYFNKLTDWGMYLSPLATKIVPISTATFMHVVGAVEIVAGLMVLSRWTKVGAYLVMLWLLGIAANLLTTGMFYDLAMRDVEIASRARTSNGETYGSHNVGFVVAVIRRYAGNQNLRRGKL